MNCASATTNGVSIDTALCDGCNRCVRDCTYGVIVPGERPGAPVTLVPGGACSECGHCVAICPHGAASLRAFDDPPEAGPLPDPAALKNLMRQRRSVRAYSSQPVAREVIDELLAAVRFAPTGCNARSVSVTVIVDPFVLQQVERHTTGFLRPLARIVANPIVSALLARVPSTKVRGIVDPFAMQATLRLVEGTAERRPFVTLGAPVLLLCHGLATRPTPVEDACIVADHIVLLATAMGLGTCWNGVVAAAFNVLPHLKRRVALPRDHTVFAALSLGWPAVKHPRPAPRRPLPVHYV
jgi:nitroreductase/NAD-dependent dihydropyrimidine dehydrogenase PreA subunit